MAPYQLSSQSQCLFSHFPSTVVGTCNFLPLKLFVTKKSDLSGLIPLLLPHKFLEWPVNSRNMKLLLQVKFHRTTLSLSPCTTILYKFCYYSSSSQSVLYGITWPERERERGLNHRGLSSAKCTHQQPELSQAAGPLTLFWQSNNVHSSYEMTTQITYVNMP